jgi:hypothetical protein
MSTGRRYQPRTALALSRAVRTATDRAKRAFPRDSTTRARLERALKLAQALERELCGACRDVLAAKARGRTRRAA